jgi:hypothetical protein
VRFVVSVTNGLKYLRNPADAMNVISLSIAIWTVEGVFFLFLLRAFTMEMGIWQAIFVMGATNLGILIPASPGFIGSFHFFCAQALVFFGIGYPTALSFATVTHLAFYIPITFWGMMIILIYGVGLRQTLRQVKKAKPIDNQLGMLSPPVKVPPPEIQESDFEGDNTFIFRLTEAVLPPDCASTKATVSNVAAFVRGQIESLPTRFQFLLKLGMAGFAAFVMVRYFRGFSSLSLDKRARAVNAWAYGEMPLTRLLFRGIHSLILLAYYDHPTVAGALESRRTDVQTIAPTQRR